MVSTKVKRERIQNDTTRGADILRMLSAGVRPEPSARSFMARHSSGRKPTAPLAPTMNPPARGHRAARAKSFWNSSSRRLGGVRLGRAKQLQSEERKGRSFFDLTCRA